MKPSVNSLLKGSGPDGIIFEVTTIGAKQEFESKTGNKFEAHNCELKTRSTGDIFPVRLFPNIVSKLKQGSLLKGVCTGQYPEWYPVPMGEGSQNFPQPSNFAQVKAEREFTESEKKFAAEKERVIISQITHGFMRGAIAAGKTVTEAKAIAKEAYAAHENLVNEICDSKVIGISSTDTSNLPF